jgi:hypothetical protein
LTFAFVLNVTVLERTTVFTLPAVWVTVSFAGSLWSGQRRSPAEGCRSGTTPDQPAASAETSDSGVITLATARPDGRATGAV